MLNLLICMNTQMADLVKIKRKYERTGRLQPIAFYVYID